MIMEVFLVRSEKTSAGYCIPWLYTLLCMYWSYVPGISGENSVMIIFLVHMTVSFVCK